MMVKMLRAALLGASLFFSASTVSLAQEATLDPSIVLQINNAAAANADPTAYAQAIAAIVAANPTMAALIAGQATQVRPGAATFIASAVAVVAPPAAAAAVVQAIVAKVPDADKASVGTTVVSNYITAAPPLAVQQIATALAPVLNTITQSAAGNATNQQVISQAIIQNQLTHPSAG